MNGKVFACSPHLLKEQFEGCLKKRRQLMQQNRPTDQFKKKKNVVIEDCESGDEKNPTLWVKCKCNTLENKFLLLLARTVVAKGSCCLHLDLFWVRRAIFFQFQNSE